MNAEGVSAFPRPTWAWSGDMPSSEDAGATETSSSTGNTPKPTPTTTTDGHPPEQSAGEPQPQPQPQPREPRYRRHYRPRECRICKEVVEPTFDFGDADGPDGTGPAIPSIPAFFGRGPGAAAAPEPQVRYESEDPESGRLISPCKCKGTQKYVHEGCLQAWREAGRDGIDGAKYWECTTCRFRYRIGRLTWGRWISSWVTRTVLTLCVLLFTIFLLGFVADPILNMWLDPLGSYVEYVHFDDDVPDGYRAHVREPGDAGDEAEGWAFHLVKGIFSLGLLGFVKSFFVMSPWQWLNLRHTGILGGGGGGRRQGTGRERLENINIAIVIVGVFTFLVAVWKGISALSAKFLNGISARVVDVHGDEPDEDEDEDVVEDQNGAAPPPEESKKDL